MTDKAQLPPVDKAGDPAADPTENVLALVDAAVKRLDDIVNAAVRRLDDLREAESGKREAISRQLFEIIELRAVHAQQLREAEAKRIDAIRAVDVNAASVDRERSAAAANVLASQVAASADALRELVATTARAQAMQSESQFKQITDRLASLEKSAYEGAGKVQATDPQLAQLLADMKTIRGTSSGGQNAAMGWIVSGIVTVGALVSMFFAFNRPG